MPNTYGFQLHHFFSRELIEQQLANTIENAKTARLSSWGLNHPHLLFKKVRVQYTPIASMNSKMSSRASNPRPRRILGIMERFSFIFPPFSSLTGGESKGAGHRSRFTCYKRLPPITYHYTTKSKKIQIFDLSFPSRKRKLRKNVTKTESFYENQE